MTEFLRWRFFVGGKVSHGGGHGALMGLSLGSHGDLTGLPWGFYGALVGLFIGLPWGCHLASMGLVWGCHGAFMRLLKGLSWSCYAAFMGPWCGLYENAGMSAVSPPPLRVELKGPRSPGPMILARREPLGELGVGGADRRQADCANIFNLPGSPKMFLFFAEALFGSSSGVRLERGVIKRRSPFVRSP